ncbi:MAG: serine hydrolase domain-containing protein [Lactobacillus sp.]|nr:serine hydrolase domain-containing protein [Lactobacillus sp.]
MLTFHKTGQLIDSLVTEGIVPGVHYAFFNREQVFTSTIGNSAIYPELKQLDPFAYYDLASLTKVVCTTQLVLEQVELGNLDFNDPINKYLPAFSDHRVQIRHLLTHTSGIRGWIPNRDQLNHDELINALINLPVTDEFDTFMRYSDTNFILLGLILKQICGKSVQELGSDLFKRMGFAQTCFHPDPAETIPTAVENGHAFQGIVHDIKARQLGKDCGSAGAFSTMHDMLNFSKSILGINQQNPYSEKMRQELFKDHTSSKVEHARSWVWDLIPNGDHYAICHTGFTGTLLVLDPANQSGLVLLSNRIHPSVHNQIFLTMRSKIIQQFIDENK